MEEQPGAIIADSGRGSHRPREDTTVKKIKLAQATEALAAYVKNIEDEPVVIVHRGFALAALVPLGNMDYESIELANNPRFLAILEASRASYEREGGIPSEEVKKMFENDKGN